MQSSEAEGEAKVQQPPFSRAEFLHLGVVRSPQHCL